MKKGILVIAVLLTFVGLALLAGALLAVGFDVSGFDTAQYETNTCSVSEPVSSIDIRSAETDITLAPSQDGSVRVVCVERNKVKHTVSAKNGTLYIAAVDTRNWTDYISFFSKPLSVTVYLPAGQYDALTTDSRTGDVLVPSDFAFETASVTASTGDVTFSADVSGVCAVHTTTGNITVQAMHAGEMDLSVSTGWIRADEIDCGGVFSLFVGSGKTNLTDVTCQSFVSGGSTGDLTMTNVIASDRFTIQRGTGDVRFDCCDANEISVKTSTGDVTGTLLTEKIFRASVSTGRVQVPETTAGGLCKIIASTGDVTIRIAGK